MMGGPLGPLGRALQEVSLTQEQQDKIHALVDAQRPILRTLRDQLRESEQAFRQAHPITEFDEAVIRAHVAEQAKIMADLEVASAGLRSKVLALLTGEQLAELKEVLAETPERVGPGDGPHGW
jgi:Spy/CpxP family protein refolding chaperone